jgi:hypothetical protein
VHAPGCDRGRYRSTDDDEIPTSPGTPIARGLTPPPAQLGAALEAARRVREALDNAQPLTRGALRAELDAFKTELLDAVREALSDARVVADRALYARVEALEARRAAAE